MGLTEEKLEKSKGYDIKPMEEREYPTWMFWKKRRYVVALLAFLGFFNVYALRVNLSIAIVAMTENKSTTINETIIYAPEFDWDSKLQGYILSSFFYGYITTQLLGGWISSRLGGKRVFGAGVATTAFLTLLTPLLATTNVYLLITVRVIEGIFEGVTYPCIHAIWARWAPPLERSRLATIAFSGCFVGTVVAMPACAYLATALGWPSIFYIFGAIGIVWCIIWFLFVSETPAEDSRISKAELKYITESLEHKIDSDKQIRIPWKEILTSPPVWALVVAHFSENWGFYTMLTQLPKFMKDILDFELGQTGFMSALPYLVMSIMIPLSGYLADWLLVKQILSTTNVRKIFNCAAFLSQTIFMLGAAFWLTPFGATLCLTLSVGLGGCSWSGFSVNYLDVAPQFASILMGLGNTFATIPGIVSPIISGYIVTTPTAEEWRIVFFISSGVYLFGCIIFGTFASGEVQSWAKEERTNDSSQNKDRGVKNEALIC